MNHVGLWSDTSLGMSALVVYVILGIAAVAAFYTVVRNLSAPKNAFYSTIADSYRVGGPISKTIRTVAFTGATLLFVGSMNLVFAFSISHGYTGFDGWNQLGKVTFLGVHIVVQILAGVVTAARATLTRVQFA